MRWYEARADLTAGYTGELHARPRWELPYVLDCPGCGGTWGSDSFRYPCADLSTLPERQEYESPDPQHYDAYVRLRERVRPLLPPDAVLRPGMGLGPLTGWGKGNFGPLFMQNPWSFYVRREALEQMQEAGLQGLQGCPMQVRFRSRTPPELLEPQLEILGELHPDCLPKDTKLSCERCGSKSYRLPELYILDAATLHTGLDIFRLEGWSALILASERFVETVKRLGLGGVVFREVAVR